MSTSLPFTLISTRAVLAGIATSALWLWSAPARAQELGRSGDFIVNAERLFGAHSARLEVDGTGGFTVRDTSVSFLMSRRSLSILTVPRVGFDYFIARSFSIGGVLAIHSADDEYSGFLLAPRVGYAIPFNRRFGFWPRGGLTFSSEGEPDRSHFAMSAEATFYFMPNATVGFTLGPFADLGITGEYETGGGDRDYNERVFGLALGMFARF